MSKNYLFRAHGLVKAYGSRYAINGLDAEVPYGTVTALLGPNGSGKSSLMRMITGMVRQDKGELEVLGRKPGWQLNELIAYLPDRAGWYNHHTVRDAMAWGASILPNFDKEYAMRLCQVMKLDPSMRITGMSKGQEARLMLTLCVARRVPLIVLDEPFSGIDLISREKIIGVLIDALSEREQSVIISTHEIVETESLFDYALFMDEGKVIRSGYTEELRAEYGSMESIYRSLYE